MGYVYVITRWGDVEWGVVVGGFLDRIAPPNERLERVMRGASQGIKWSQSVSSPKAVSDRNSMYTPKYLFNSN